MNKAILLALLLVLVRSQDSEDYFDDQDLNQEDQDGVDQESENDYVDDNIDDENQENQEIQLKENQSNILTREQVKSIFQQALNNANIDKDQAFTQFYLDEYWRQSSFNSVDEFNAEKIHQLQEEIMKFRQDKQIQVYSELLNKLGLPQETNEEFYNHVFEFSKEFQLSYDLYQFMQFNKITEKQQTKIGQLEQTVPQDECPDFANLRYHFPEKVEL